MKIKVIIPIALLFFFSYCGPQSKLIKPSPDLPETTTGLYNTTVKNNIPFKNLVIKNIKINYQTSNNNTTLYGAAKLKKDSLILLSLRSPLGIELSRILYSRDSIKMLDRRNKTAYFTDYKHLSDIVPFDLNFQVLQTIFTGNVPVSYKNTGMPEPGFVRDTLKNEIYMGTFRAPGNGNKMDFYSWIYTNPVKPSYLVFYREDKNDKFTLQFREYEPNDNYYLPNNVMVTFSQYNHTSTIKLNLKGIQRNDSPSIRLDVPSSYKKVRR
jgi:hypothetical protein